MKHNFQVTIEVDDATGSVQAAYFTIRNGRSAVTREFCDGAALVDYDKNGNLLGIELLAPCQGSALMKIEGTEPAVTRFVERTAPRELVPA